MQKYHFNFIITLIIVSLDDLLGFPLIVNYNHHAPALSSSLSKSSVSDVQFPYLSRQDVSVRTMRKLRMSSNDEESSGSDSVEEGGSGGEEEIEVGGSAPRLVSSVTAESRRDLDEDEGGKIPRDGSLLLLIPSLAIAIGGFAVAINIAMNSPDAVSQVTSEIEENIAASFKPKPAIYESDGECRGLCSNQDKDIDNLRSFLNRISGADAGTASDDVYVPESENSTPAVSENDVKEEVVEPVENSNLSTDSAPKEDQEFV